MTKEYLEEDGTFSPATQLHHEVEQLKRLLPLGLSEEELCHRLATSKTQLRRMKKLIGD